MTAPVMQPFTLIWKLVTGILVLTGRLVAGIIGTVFVVLGVVLCITVIGAIAGVPLILIGILLILRCLF
ncbi:MAG: hypothetical protein K8S15_00815 [Candidatus Aegiribacteria sp.]|nr:hypothetical protein [Candidatus Aegiribacteria sp.]